MRPAVFLDRDGVLVRDVGPLSHARDIILTPEAPSALTMLKSAGFLLVVVSNQTVVARGLLDEPGVRELQGEVESLLLMAGGPPLDGFYYCPHHPAADVLAYRMACRCRKPAPGLLERAADEQGIRLENSFMVGDRPSDVVAGHRAGCVTVQVESGRHRDPLIEASGGFDPIAADFVAKDLRHAAAFICAAS